MRSTTDGAFHVSYDDIEWKEIRDTQGWAGLQHHSLIRATLTIWPPSTPIDPDGAQFPRAIFASVSQGSMFVLLSRSTAATKNEKPTWHIGNIYAMREVPQRISLPGDISTTSPTQFDLLISADYEIRLFGDPRVTAQSDSPVTKVAVRLALGSENGEEPRIQLGEDHIAPDFEGGWAVGDAVGVEVTSHGGDWTVMEVKSLDPVRNIPSSGSNSTNTIPSAPQLQSQGALSSHYRRPDSTRTSSHDASWAAGPHDTVAFRNHLPQRRTGNIPDTITLSAGDARAKY